MKLRRIDNLNLKDCKFIFKLANDFESRNFSFCQKPISWKKHVDWFSKKILDKTCYFFIATDENNRRIGQVRFEKIQRDETKISISILKSKRNQGIGQKLIIIATNKIFKETHYRIINAFIKEENIKSTEAFKKAGFYFSKKEIIKNNSYIHLIKKSR